MEVEALAHCDIIHPLHDHKKIAGLQTLSCSCVVKYLLGSEVGFSYMYVMRGNLRWGIVHVCKQGFRTDGSGLRRPWLGSFARKEFKVLRSEKPCRPVPVYHLPIKPHLVAVPVRGNIAIVRATRQFTILDISKSGVQRSCERQLEIRLPRITASHHKQPWKSHSF